LAVGVTANYWPTAIKQAKTTTEGTPLAHTHTHVHRYIYPPQSLKSIMLKQYPANGASTHTTRINWLSLTGIFCNSHSATPHTQHQKLYRQAAKGTANSGVYRQIECLK